MLSFEDFEGQSAYVAQLERDFAAGTFVHAYLLSGPYGTGKKSVAKLCAMAALCRGEKKPCGECGPCRRVLSGSHPDVHEVVPEKGKKTIGVDVMREAIEEVGVKSFEDGAKILIVPQAEKLTPAAQNCLLKTLEEPPQGTVFFLVTEQPASLLPTIVSRCRVVRFHPLTQEETERRLTALGQSPREAREKARMADGCVGRALEIDDAQLELRRKITQDVFSVRGAADVLTVLNTYKDSKDEQKIIMDALESAVRDILMAQAGKAPLEDAGYAREAEAYARAVPLSGGLLLSQRVTQAKRMLGSNVAFASAFESILLTISEEYAKWPW